jgi:predicted nucleic acid-binding protein
VFVLDTDVISRTSPISRMAGAVQGWLAKHEDRSFLSAATLAELHHGVARVRLEGATRKADVLQRWVAEVTQAFEDRLLPVDERIARRTGEYLARAEKAGFDPGFVDACLAATADVLGYEVVTFNARDFAALGASFRVPGDGDA